MPLPDSSSIALGWTEQEVPKGAGFWHRALARVLDLLIHAMAAFVAMIPTAIVLRVFAALTHRDLQVMLERLQKFSILGGVLSIIGSFLYHAISEGLHGSSLGKRICGLVVLSENRTPCSMRAAFGRSAAFYIDGMFFGAIAAGSMSDSPMRQRLGDKWNHIIVQRRRDAPATSLRSGSRFFAVTVAACALDVAILCVGFILRALV